MAKLWSAALAFAVMAAAGPAPAADTKALADLPLEQLLDLSVAGSSRFTQRRSEAAAVVTVITRQEIEALGYHTLSDALRAVRGVTVVSDRTYDYVGVRGFLDSGDYNTRLLLLIDGNRVNDALYDQAFVGNEFPLDLDMVERIEFVPGQGSAVYGANALFGVINVITREAPRRPVATGSVILGSGGERRVSASVRGPIADGGLSVHGSRLLRSGEDVFDPAHVGVAGSDGWSRDTDYERRSALFMRWDRGAFSANLVHADRVKGNPVPVLVIFDDPTNRDRDTYTALNLEWSANLAANLAGTSRLFAGRYEFVGDYAIDYPPPSHNRDVARARWYGVELRLSREEAGRHRFDVGVEVQRTDALEQTNFDLQPEPYTYLDDRRDAWRVSAYAEDRVRLASHWSSHLGLRADRASGRRAELSPRLALNCAINDRLDVKLIYGRSYRPPNAFQAYYEVNGPGGYERNPDLRPEAVHGEELAVDWRPRPRWRLSGSLFYSSTHDLMQLGSIADGTMYRFENVGRLSARGAEVELEFVGNATHLRANYTLARTDADTGLGNLKHFPRQMLKAVAFTELRTAWTLAAEAAAVSARGAAPGYAVANLNLGWQARETGPRASCGLFNVFDRKIYDPGSDPVAQPITSQSGRVWRVELSWPVTF